MKVIKCDRCGKIDSLDQLCVDFLAVVSEYIDCDNPYFKDIDLCADCQEKLNQYVKIFMEAKE